MSSTINIQVGDRTLTATKAHLKLWLQLSDTYEKFLQASKDSSYLLMADAVYEYLELALGGIFNWHEVGWLDTIDAFSKLVTLNIPTLAVPITAKVDKPERPEKYPWEYRGRTWYAWAHTLCGSYGWSLEYVAELEIEDAMALLQEIELDKQFDREFDWSLSEIAYPYNDSIKKSEFKPLPRPNWMLPKAEVKKIQIPRSMLPMGVVENVSGMFAENVVTNNA